MIGTVFTFLKAHKVAFFVASLVLFFVPAFYKVGLEQKLSIYDPKKPDNTPGIKRDFTLNNMLGYALIIPAFMAFVGLVLIIFF